MFLSRFIPGAGPGRLLGSNVRRDVPRSRETATAPSETSRIAGTSGTPGTIVELDRWQLTGLLFGVLAIALVAFFVGRALGKGSASAPPPAVPVAALTQALPQNASSRERQIALAAVWPPTSGIDDSLSRPIEQPLPSDPTERARAQAHLQLQEARAIGLRDSVTPTAPAPNSPIVTGPMVMPTAPGASRGLTLQVSMFDSQASAQVLANQLEASGTAVRVRQVNAADGRAMFRVEVGDFTTSAAALAFQRRFERDTGYAGVLITL